MIHQAKKKFNHLHTLYFLKDIGYDVTISLRKPGIKSKLKLKGEGRL
jgi:hypothetical protein